MYNYQRFRSDVLESDDILPFLHWCSWEKLPPEAKLVICNECCRAKLTGSGNFSDTSCSCDIVDKIQKNDSLLWISQCVHKLANYYVGRAANKSKKSPVVDVDDSSVALSVGSTRPSLAIYHPRHSKYYSFVFVIAKSIHDVISNNNVPGDVSCGYHSVVRSTLHFVQQVPDEFDKLTDIGLLNLTPDHTRMVHFAKLPDENEGWMDYCIGCDR